VKCGVARDSGEGRRGRSRYLFRLGRSLGDESGQGLIEMALISMVLMFLLLGTVDFSRFLYYTNTIDSAARVGAEVAMLRCPGPSNCDVTHSVPVTNDVVLQDTLCAANQNPYSSSMGFTLDSSIAPTSTQCSGTPCDGISVSCAVTATEICGVGGGNDVCITRGSATTGTCSNDPAGNQSPTSGQCVEVIIGWKFTPITPLINQFFHTQSCWVGDTATHNLCASAIGKVS
jgi:hypothetical protein